MKPAHTALLTVTLLAVWPCLAQTQTSPTMSFFVTSVGKNGGSGNLGGLQGADAHCQSLADRVGAGQREWRAYLSTAARGAQPGVDARERIGIGPWYNAKGVLIARDLNELHSDRNRVDRHTAINERGEPIAPNQHDILTGSDEHGRVATVYGRAATCENWTSEINGHAMLGHHDRFMDRGPRFPRWNRSWAAAHPTRGCDSARVKQTGSAGLFYCFARDSVPVSPEVVKGTTPAFRRGLNVAHWLSHNYLPDAPYGAPWFDEQDVAWIAGQGFDHLRLRIAGDRLISKNGDIDVENVAHIDRALAWARKYELGVVLTMFSLPGFRHGVLGEPARTDKGSPFTDLETRYDAEYVWWQLARRYADEGTYLRFEMLHRPDAPDVASMQTFNEPVLRAIRASNPTRVVYVTSRAMDEKTLNEVLNSDLLSTDWNIALAFAGTGVDAFAVQVDTRFSKFAEAARRLAWGREIYLAEFCTSDPAEARSIKTAAESSGFAWAVYDYQSGCAVREGAGTGKPTPVLQALDLLGK